MTSKLALTGIVTIKTIPDGRPQDMEVLRFKNLETSYVLEAIAKAFAGEEMDDITPTSMALGNGDTAVANDQTSIASEIMRKAVTVSRVANKAVYTITLNSGESLGYIGTVGLFNGDSGAGSPATGILVIAGTSITQGASITVSLDARALPAFTVTDEPDAAAVATAFKAHLEGDDTFNSLYTIAKTGSTLNITSRGNGVVYNRSMTASVSGGVTCTATGISGGTTPGGTLLAAANVNYTKRASTQVVVEWSIAVSN